MKNYITTEALPEIINDLAEKFLEEFPKLSLNIDFSVDTCGPKVRIVVETPDKTETLAERSYIIIGKVSDTYDVLGATIEDAIEELKYNSRS